MPDTSDRTSDAQTATTDPAAAALQAWRSVMDAPAIPGAPRDWLVTELDAWFITTARTAMPRLVAALEAVLKLHQPGRVMILGALCKRHESHRHFSITSTEADSVRACQDCTATVYRSCTGCGPQVSVDACPNRAAITAALIAKETPSA